jgi:hypothetical protein
MAGEDASGVVDAAVAMVRVRKPTRARRQQYSPTRIQLLSRHIKGSRE